MGLNRTKTLVRISTNGILWGAEAVLVYAACKRPENAKRSADFIAQRVSPFDGVDRVRSVAIKQCRAGA